MASLDCYCLLIKTQQLQMNNKGETELLEFNKHLFYNDTNGNIV